MTGGSHGEQGRAEASRRAYLIPVGCCRRRLAAGPVLALFFLTAAAPGGFVDGRPTEGPPWAHDPFLAREGAGEAVMQARPIQWVDDWPRPGAPL